MKEQREAFEAWYKKTYTHFGQAIFLLNANNEYVDDIIEASWKAWKAALSAVPAQEPVKQEPYAYDVETNDGGTQLIYAIYYTKYNNTLPDNAIPLYTPPPVKEVI